jgi:tetratricopeptide (TPR) repeat protein
LTNLRISNHLAVRTAFDSSYATLSANEARAFRLLALYPGTWFDTAAVAALLDSSTEQAQRTVEILAGTSLINNDAAVWRMHDLLRLYANDLLDQYESVDDQRTALIRLLDYFCESAAATARRFVTSDFLTALRNQRLRALSSFDHEAETLTVALGTAYDGGLHKHVLRLANSLSRFFAVRPLSLDWLTIFTRAVDSVRELDAEEAIAHFLRQLGDTCVRLKQFDQATEHFREVIQVSVGSHLDTTHAAAWNGLANVHLDCGDPASAIRCGEQALAIFRELGDQRNESAALGNLANACRELRWFDAAFKHYHDSLAIARSLGDKQAEGIDLTNLARAHHMRGNLTEAIDYLETALALRTSIGDINGAAKACSEIANAYEPLGQLTDALQYRELALQGYRESRDRHQETNELWCIGSLHSRLGQPPEAVRHLRASLDLGTWSDPRRHADLLNTLAAEYCKLRDFPLAIDCFSSALAIYTDCDDERAAKMVLTNLMRAYYDMGVPNAAVECGRQ